MNAEWVPVGVYSVPYIICVCVSLFADTERRCAVLGDFCSETRLIRGLVYWSGICVLCELNFMSSVFICSSDHIVCNSVLSLSLDLSRVSWPLVYLIV